MISIRPSQPKRATGRWRTVPLAVACSLLAHVLAAVSLALSPGGRLTDELMAEVEFAGSRGVVLIEASFAAAPPPAPSDELPRTEPPVEVTPQEARIEQRLYRQAPAQSEAFAEASVELSEWGELPPAVGRPAEIATESQPATGAPRQSSLSKAPAEPPAIAVTPPAAGAAPMTPGFETAASFAGNAPPVYPAIAVANRWSGNVLLKLWIDETGAVTDVSVERSSGYGVLDASAVNAVRHWRGRPKRIDGRRVDAVELQEIRFRLPQ
jgi:protein TonB